MANIKSQIKRNRRTRSARERNKAVRSELKTRVEGGRPRPPSGAEDADEPLPAGAEAHRQGRRQGRHPQERGRPPQVPPGQEAATSPAAESDALTRRSAGAGTRRRRSLSAAHGAGCQAGQAGHQHLEHQLVGQASAPRRSRSASASSVDRPRAAVVSRAAAWPSAFLAGNVEPFIPSSGGRLRLGPHVGAVEGAASGAKCVVQDGQDLRAGARSPAPSIRCSRSRASAMSPRVDRVGEVPRRQPRPRRGTARRRPRRAWRPAP